MQEPKRSSIDDIAVTTQLYLDTYVALEMLHCTYGEYIQRTTRLERLAHQFYVMLKNAKEEHARDEMEREADAQRAMEHGMMTERY